MKTILAVWHTANKGKSETLREFARFLLATYPAHIPIFPNLATVPPSGDFRLIVEINGVIVGIESQGDPYTNLKNRLIDLVDKHKCEIILCTTRTKGETVDAVDHICSSKGYQTIWTSTYQVDTQQQQLIANRLKGEHILELLQGLGLI